MEQNIYNLIREWAEEKGIYAKGDSKTQVLKLGEEFGELCKAVLKRDDEEVYDAIGDCVVVLTNVVKLYELEKTAILNEPVLQMNIEKCVESAYKVISNRKGKMENGTFVKDK